jgi:hypothetical protein
MRKAKAELVLGRKTTSHADGEAEAALWDSNWGAVDSHTM